MDAQVGSQGGYASGGQAVAAPLPPHTVSVADAPRGAYATLDAEVERLENIIGMFEERISVTLVPARPMADLAKIDPESPLAQKVARLGDRIDRLAELMQRVDL